MPAAERELSTVIEAGKAVATNPRLVAWYVPSAIGGVPLFGGAVELADCSVPAAQIRQAALGTGHDDISTLQERLQSKIDTRVTPEPIRTEWTPPEPEALSPSPPITLNQRGTTVSAPAATTAVVRPIAAPTGGATRDTPIVRPVRLPSPLWSPGVRPRPAAAGDPIAADPGGAPHHPSAPHRSTSRTARSGR